MQGALRRFPILFTLVALACTAEGAAAGTARFPVDVGVSSGVHFTDKNDTAIPKLSVGVPLAGSVAWNLDRHWAIEGQVHYILPLKRDVDVAPGVTSQRKSPDALDYEVGIRGSLPIDGTPWSPYARLGIGAMTFLSNTDADRMPKLVDAQTVLAASAGIGTTFRLTPNWALTGEFCATGAFPSSDTGGLSTSGSADPIWMERISVGARFTF